MLLVGVLARALPALGANGENGKETINMKHSTRFPVFLSLMAGLCLALGMASFTMAQSGAAQSHESEKSATKSISGTLANVDSMAKTLSVKTKQGTDMDFHYTDQTQVEGAEGGVQGLASKDGSELTVMYREDSNSGERTAVSIKIGPPAR
jgi:hypothetical protein